MISPSAICSRGEKVFVEWDAHQNGLGVRVQPTGKKTFVCVYSFKNKVRWYTIGSVADCTLAAARKQACDVMHQVVVLRNDPAADRAAQSGKITFEALANRYVDEYAKRKK